MGKEGNTKKELEQYYTAAQVAAKLACDAQTVTKLFKDEPGVVNIAGEGGKRKRLRIPESVVARVLLRRSI